MASEAGKIVGESPMDATGNNAGKLRLRSLNDLDRRTRSAQIALAIRDELISDLGGADRMSSAQRLLVDSAAFITAMVRSAATGLIAGGSADVSELTTLINAQRRLLATLGLEQRAETHGPPIKGIVEEIIDDVPYGGAAFEREPLPTAPEPPILAANAEVEPLDLSGLAKVPSPGPPPEPHEPVRQPGISRKALAQLGPRRPPGVFF